MQSEHEESTVEYVWREGDIVWAKITGHPWWPAIVTQVPSFPNDHIRVDFFADNSHAFVSAGKLTPYEEHRQSINMHRHMVRGLRKAVLEADQVYRYQPALKKDPCKVCRKISSPSTHSQQLMHAILQQNNKPPQQQSSPNIPSPTKIQSAPAQQDSQQSPQQKPVSPTYTKQQRERYVTDLLKKYQLSTIPRSCRKEESQEKHPQTGKVHKSRQIRKQMKHNRSRSEESHLNPRQHLARKLFGILSDKKCGTVEQCRGMSLSLSKQVLAGSDNKQNFLRLVKWLQITANSTINCYYQSWAGLQTDKDKASIMTNEQ